MRIRLVAQHAVVSGAALAISLPLLLCSAAYGQQASPDAGAVNQGSPVTEQILKELRAGKSGEDAVPALTPIEPAAPAASSPATPNATVPAPTTAPGLIPIEGDPIPAGPAQDGSLAEPAPPSATTDGLLKEQSPSSETPPPADGDLSADGKLVQPSGGATDPVAKDVPVPSVPVVAPAAATPDAAAPVVTRRMTPPPVSQPDARAVAGRPRQVAEDNSPPRRRKSHHATVVKIRELANDQGASDADAAVAGDDGVSREPSLRGQITELDDNPYAPVGYRFGSFVLKPSITAETVYSSNVLQSHDHGQADGALVLRPGFALESQWSRHFVSLDVRGLTSSHARIKSEDDRQLNANLRGRLDITDRTSLEGEVGYDFGQLARSNPVLPNGAVLRPSTRTEMVGLALNQRINRVSLRLHGTLADTLQGDAGTGGESYRDDTIDIRAGYELSPRLTVFGTAKRFDRVFGNLSGTDSVGNELRLGIETDQSAILSAAATVGAARVTSANGALPDATGFVGDANVIWLPSALTTLTFAASTDFSLTDLSGATAVRTSKASVDLRHEFRRWLALIAGFSETRRSYAGLALEETEWSSHLGLEYDLNRNWALTGDYQRTNLASSDPARGYADDQVKFGVRLQK